MSEIVRLIRLSLLLRLLPSVAALAVGMVNGVENSLPLSVVTVLPSLIVLGASYLPQRRGEVTPRHVRMLLVAAILVYSFESLFPLFANEFVPLRGLISTRFFVGNRPPGPPGPPSPPGASGAPAADFDVNRLLGAFFTVPLLFSLIPTVLGAWLEGKRGWWKWALFTIALNAASISITVIASGQVQQTRQLQFNIGGTVAQSLVIAVVCYFVASLADQLRTEQRQLEAANLQLAEQGRVREQLATSRERMRLSRDLHDTLAHTLAGLIVQLKAIGTLLEKQPEAAKREVLKAEGAARQGLDDTRAAIGDLRANMVRDLGLSGALQRQVQTMNERGATRASFQQVGDEPTLSDSEAEGLFRITQEALNNVQRHAGASHAAITLESASAAATAGSRRVTISIVDDGVGFNANALDDSRFGLRGMRERADELGAHLRVDSASGQGTTVTVTLNGKA